ncbi:MAG TPA: glycosyltransferase [Candidatus Udaeobacter sp.]|jgi:glycosyltransferase involved in cell wall biosynthesis|nr:glycosyltransferase [Candidatus Udaeobacter sp.]
MTVSFIIPAYNEEHSIARTLGSIAEAARALGEPHEIIVADDGSTDRTGAVAEAHGARVIRVRHRHIAATRNSGARAATGDRFIFVDADTQVTAALVRAALAAMSEGAIGGGCAVKFDDPLPRYARVIEWLLDDSFRHAKLAAGCFLFCTREGFGAAGGFDESVYGGEEILMSQALKRHGRFVVLRELALTSGRKLRAYSGAEVFQTLMYLLANGRKSVESRAGLDFWYAPRREDPLASPVPPD